MLNLNKFRQLVADANGKSEVNAIMDADFSISNPVGLDIAPYRGTFNGNGHTLNVNIDWGTTISQHPSHRSIKPLSRTKRSQVVSKAAYTVPD